MLYELVVETNTAERAVRFRLRNEHGVQLAYHDVLLPQHSPALWEGLFDTGQYVHRYTGNLRLDAQTEPATAQQLIDHLGTFLGQEVLGPEILGQLTKERGRRTLLVRLPAAADPLAAAFARVPWEIARDGPGQPPLMERNLIVRAVTKDTAQPDAAVADAAARLAAGEPLRILLVFAEAPGSRPLAMRLEREELLDLFHNHVLPNRRVEVDVLCHGVTRSAIRECMTASGGYHVLHWSGHGHLNLLELRGEDGSPDPITGEGLIELFADAGGFIPQLVFLSACLSATFVRDLASLEAVTRGESPGQRQKPPDARPLDELLGKASGYTGTALALLRSGVPQVIAMRYSVGDDYARELARSFYKRLLADDAQPSTDDALALARTDLLKDQEASRQYSAVDHATALMFGRDGRLPRPLSGRSRQMAYLRPRPQPLLPGGSHELDCPANFVGRGAQLTELSTRWLAHDGPAVALIQGLAGLGKTALAAEAVHLWHRRFDWVLAFQAKPTPLAVDEFFRQVDAKLILDSKVYAQSCQENANQNVYLKPGKPLSGEERYERIRTNLLEALRDEATLLVLDNFEPNLEEHPASGAHGYASADPQWDRILATLARELPATRSRVLLTSRHRLAALASEQTALCIPLGPLTGPEALLYVPTHEKLARLFHSGKEGKELVNRLLHVSRGHPLIMDRLAALADDHRALAEALDKLQSKGGQALPELFTARLSEEDRERERQYLEDVVVGSVDLLICRLTPAARRLLWVVTLANEPVAEQLLEGVWSGRSLRDQQLAPTDAADVPPIGPLLEELHMAGLLTRQEAGRPPCDRSSAPQEAPRSTYYAFHELVRERIADWMAHHASERAGRTDEQVWLAYSEWYAAIFHALQMSGREMAREAAAEAGRRGLVYMIRARAFDRLGSFASDLVTGTSDPTLLRGVIAELETIADQVPPGKVRWRVRSYLAVALARSGRPDETLGLYEQAAHEAEEAQHWSNVAPICANWAVALAALGQLDESKATYLRSAAAHRNAGSPRICTVATELEALRIDVMQGQAEQALPEIEKRLDEVRGWWQQSRAGQRVPEAPDAVDLSRVLVSGLDVARLANSRLKRWQGCLDLLEEIDQAQREVGESRHQLAQNRFNRYFPLVGLGRLGEAQRLVEGCLEVFRNLDDLPNQAKVLSALAEVWDRRGDTHQAIALERQALAVHNGLPYPSHRGISHASLSTYLGKAKRPEEVARHQLASIVYYVVSSHQVLPSLLHNLGIHIRRAAQSGGRYELPRLADLLAQPEFDALRQFLDDRRVDLQELQARIDQLVDQLR